MDYRPFDITLHSASGLKDVNFFSSMRVYVVVSIVGDSNSRQETPISKCHRKNPAWEFGMRFYVEESKLHQNCLMLVLKLRCSQTVGGDKDVGEVCVPLKKLFDSAEGQKEIPAVTYKVTTPAGKQRGVLCFSYGFGKTIPVRTAVPSEPCLSPSAPYLPPEGYFFPGYGYI
ncbi:hypothetical protein L1049_019736 [Liquidambar formosana]|uniref:C2 domain-containing protein n=1 Tax=Liquidambar formosana TaxID=63359 RepID=A0AAP0S6N3_LIQFO